MTITLRPGSTVMFTGDSATDCQRLESEDGLGFGYPPRIAGEWGLHHPDRPVTWLVSYVTWDEATPRPRGVRLSVLRVTLPEAAGARLKAILARAAARPAPATPPDREAASGTGSAGPETPPA